MHRRRYSNGLDTKQVKELTYGWQHAARIGYPLNVMITIRPFEDHGAATHCKIGARVRNKLGVYARLHRFPLVAAWSRECNEDGSGEHLHVLMHVPRKYYADLTAKVIGWFPEPGSADVRLAHQDVTLTPTGKRMSAIGYIAKQMTPQAWYRRVSFVSVAAAFLESAAALLETLASLPESSISKKRGNIPSLCGDPP